MSESFQYHSFVRRMPYTVCIFKVFKILAHSSSHLIFLMIWEEGRTGYPYFTGEAIEA